jgi:ribonuclease VapC
MPRQRVSRAVLDSSAVLASFYGEAGADAIDAILRESVISTVNAAEVISKLVERGMTAAMARSALIDTGIEIVPFDLDQAEVTGDLRGKTRAQGLSLGDRACLALAKRINGRAVTADRAWISSEDLGVEIVLFRGEH